jgi:hypothetical protein
MAYSLCIFIFFALNPPVKSRQRPKLSPQSSEFGLPHPRRRVCTTKAGGTLACGREGGGSQFQRGDLAHRRDPLKQYLVVKNLGF